MRRRGRVDENHAAIVDLLRGFDCSVISTAGVGDGFPDLVVGFQGVTHLIEIKDGDKSPSRRRLTDDEREWHATWRGEAVYVLESARDAEQLVRQWYRDAAKPGGDEWGIVK
jgi:hypothetical protein